MSSALRMFATAGARRQAEPHEAPPGGRAAVVTCDLWILGRRRIRTNSSSLSVDGRLAFTFTQKAICCLQRLRLNLRRNMNRDRAAGCCFWAHPTLQRNCQAAWLRRHGRGLPRPRSAPGARSGRQSPARFVLQRPGAPAAFRAGSPRHGCPEPGPSRFSISAWRRSLAASSKYVQKLYRALTFWLMIQPRRGVDLVDIKTRTGLL